MSGQSISTTGPQFSVEYRPQPVTQPVTLVIWESSHHQALRCFRELAHAASGGELRAREGYKRLEIGNLWIEVRSRT